jgi:nitrogen-specific signal transduction histidine kinase/CheY-like chemotaxis protein
MIAQDITEQIKLQNQLQQARKMEAVGQLAAGVAHDFNNILTVVQGNASLLLASNPPESEDAKPLQSICAAADRASRLVRQLLTFSRRQPVELRPINLRDTLATVWDILPRILTERVKVTLHAPPGLPDISADGAMLETLIMNLAFNARDAMPEGGQLSITAEAVELPAAADSNPEAHAGQFVRLTVSDTGTGIPPEDLPRIFDPFFTTKPVGKGTGLGLATVYGIAQQHHGWVEVRSEVGVGTTFLVFIPALLAARPPQPAAKPPPPETAGTGRETILVVEDEPDLRDLVAQVLESRDYRVLTAASGAKALETWSRREGDIHLLLTDMVMPDGLTGRKLAEKLTGEDPRLRVIFTSGYSAGMPGTDLDNVEEGSFLPKPYRSSTLLQIVRDCLDRPVSRAVAA